jgi:integrase
MRWSDARNGRVNVVQEKTGKHINIRMVDALEQEISAAPKTGITILTQENGKRLQVPTLRKWLQDYASELGFKIVPHGLRKNAVNSLLEAGCTIAETASVTGQSFEMVEHYARRVDQSRLGDAAILKLERSVHIQTNSKTAS